VTTERIPLVIDVDTGTDDAVCLTAAIRSGDLLDLRGFSAVCGNVTVDRTARNTLDVVRYLGHDGPVAVGAAQPLVRPLATAISHGRTGLGDVVLPRAEGPFSPLDPADLLLHEARAHPGTLEVLASAP